MNNVARTSTALGLFLLLGPPTPAHAADGDKEPLLTRPPTIGYQVETGIATTRLDHGGPKYDTKSTPATEDLANVRVNDLGPGVLQAGSIFAMALSDSPKRREVSTEIVPYAMYSWHLGMLAIDTGAKVTFFPRAVQPRKDIEGILHLSLPNRFVTPTLDVVPSLPTRQGAYSFFGLEHLFSLRPWLTIRPRVALGAQAYSDSNESIHVQDLSASAAMQASLGSGFYAAVRPSISMLGGPARYCPDATLEGRSTGYLGLAFGAQR